MDQLTITRTECIEVIYLIASDLRYHAQRADDWDATADQDRDRVMECINEIQVRQNIMTMVQLLKLIADHGDSD